MHRHVLTTLLGLIVAVGFWLTTFGVSAQTPADPAPTAKPDAPAPVDKDPAPTEVEARGRARLLHEAFHATLQYVHHEYYRADEQLPLPAATLDRVFKEMATRQNVKLRWLAVSAQAMNVDHTAQDEFEKASVVALTAGQTEFARVEQGVYRHAGAITLGSECLKCHVPGRTSNKDRTAALVISIPLRDVPPAKGASK